MKFAVCTLGLLAVLALVSADADNGHFIPKAFYTLDSHGLKSDVHPINPHTAHYLRRLRRQVISSSSSSSSSSSDGGPTFFSTQTINSHAPDVDFASRFGGEPVATGHVVQTHGYVDQYGQIHANVQKGQF